MTGSTKQSILQPASCEMDCFASLAMTLWEWGFELQTTDMNSRSRGALRPKFSSNLPPSAVRGRGEAGRPMRPIAACAKVVVEGTRVSQVTPESPGTPHAMVYGLYVISSASPALLPPSPARLDANLTPALGVSEPHDFTIRFQRSGQKRRPRPPHPRPASVTLQCPSGWDGMARDIA